MGAFGRLFWRWVWRVSLLPAISFSPNSLSTHISAQLWLGKNNDLGGLEHIKTRECRQSIVNCWLTSDVTSIEPWRAGATTLTDCADAWGRADPPKVPRQVSRGSRAHPVAGHHPASPMPSFAFLKASREPSENRGGMLKILERNRSRRARASEICFSSA